MTIKVVKLGQFAGGSFGVPGHPCKTYMLWAVQCQRNPMACRLPVAGFVYRSEAEAESAAERERAYEAGRQDERAARADKIALLHREIERGERGWVGYRIDEESAPAHVAECRAELARLEALR